MMWYDTFDAVFFLSLGSIIYGGLGVTLSYCFKSKCNDFTLCYGMVHVERNVLAENEESKVEMEHQRHRSGSEENRV